MNWLLALAVICVAAIAAFFMLTASDINGPASPVAINEILLSNESPSVGEGITVSVSAQGHGIDEIKLEGASAPPVK